MIDLLIAFLLGNLVHRIYYARINKKTDWMNSWEWSNNKYYKKLHRFLCEICPKRHYCDRYIKEKKKCR